MPPKRRGREPARRNPVETRPNKPEERRSSPQAGTSKSSRRGLPPTQDNDVSSNDFDLDSSALDLSRLSLSEQRRSDLQFRRQTRTETSRISEQMANIPQPARARKRKVKPRALQEIRKLQANVKLTIPRLPFCRLVRETLLAASNTVDRINRNAFDALQEACEMYMVQLLEDAYRCTLHRQRVTLMPKDVKLTRYLRGQNDPGNP